MAAARFAPVLSATSKIERICNINSQSGGHGSHGLAALHHFHQVAGAAGPRREPGSDNPNPRPERISKNPTPPRSASPRKKMTQSWYFRGAPLGLDMVPGMSGAGRDPEQGRSTSSPQRTPGRAAPVRLRHRPRTAHAQPV